MADATHDATRADDAAIGVRAVAGSTDDVEALLPPEAESPRARAVLERIAKAAVKDPDVSGVAAADFHARVLPLPRPLREFISRRITKAFLKDVNEFLFVKERREAMRASALSRLRAGGGPFVVIGHSQGSMVAYDALSSLSPDEIEVDLFVTIGSPLGLKEVQDQLEVITGQKKGLAVPRVVKRWINVADPLDPVCADKRLAKDYARDERRRRRGLPALEQRFTA